MNFLPNHSTLSAPGLPSPLGLPQAQALPGMQSPTGTPPIGVPGVSPALLAQYMSQYWQLMMLSRMNLLQQQAQQQQQQQQQQQHQQLVQAVRQQQTLAPGGLPQPNDQGLFVLFVYHLPHNVTEEMLRSLFGKYGEVHEIVIMRDNMNDPNSRTKGFGFVKYRSYEEAAMAVQFLNGAPLENKRLEVSFKLPKGNKRIVPM